MSFKKSNWAASGKLTVITGVMALFTGMSMSGSSAMGQTVTPTVTLTPTVSEKLPWPQMKTKQILHNTEPISMRDVSEFELKRRRELEEKGFPESYKPPKSEVKPTLPPLTNFKIEPLDGGASLTWDAVPGAESYHLYISDDGRRFRRCINRPIQNTSIIIGDLENGKMYYFAIAPQSEILEGTKAVRTVVPTRQMTKDQ